LFFAIGNSPVLQKQFLSEGVGNFAEGQGKKTGTKIGRFASPDSLIDLYPIYNDFAKGLQADFTAVQNAFLMPISNGVVEGNVNRLKAIKRQMYGRAWYDLLAKKVMYYCTN